MLDYVGHLRADGAALAGAATGNLHLPVPSCPGWTVAELVAHAGRVHRHKLALLRAASTRPPDLPQPPSPPAGDALIGWFLDGLSQLAELLAATDPDAPAWSWAGDHRVGFWRRRMAHETALHRWDAEAAASRAGPLDAELAADGIDEYFEVFMRVQPPYGGPRGTLHVHRLDGPGEWLVHLRPGRPLVERGHARAQAALRGTASDLLLVLWRRRPVTSVALAGDAALVEGLLGWIELS